MKKILLVFLSLLVISGCSETNSSTGSLDFSADEVICEKNIDGVRQEVEFKHKDNYVTKAKLSFYFDLSKSKYASLKDEKKLNQVSYNLVQQVQSLFVKIYFKSSSNKLGTLNNLKYKLEYVDNNKYLKIRVSGNLSKLNIKCNLDDLNYRLTSNGFKNKK